MENMPNELVDMVKGILKQNIESIIWPLWAVLWSDTETISEIKTNNFTYSQNIENI